LRCERIEFAQRIPGDGLFDAEVERRCEFFIEPFDRALGHVGLTERVGVVARVSEQLQLRYEPGAIVGKQGVLLIVRVGATVVPNEFVPVAKIADVAAGCAATVVVGGREVALFNIDGTFYAIENACPHQGGPLAEGFIDGTTVTCPWHAWTFKLTDGKMTLGAFSFVYTYDVRIDGEWVMVSSEPRVP
jgi:nitrite reductase/ring-hydroxylating ferredoxin subunit